MDSIKEYINSGILDLYVLGLTSEEENKEIARLSDAHPEIAREIEQITEAAITAAESNAPEIINPSVKPMIMAIINFTERLQSGETPVPAPRLSEASKVGDFQQWLDRKDFVLPDDFNDIHARIIAHEPDAMTALVWIKDSSPYEVHDNEFERFLIVEGTCDITIGEKVHSLVPGDFLSIPLHQGHVVKVTSVVPCKVILQRVAA
jgi:mannose-6-phosphate isomerase-like protein (cupin superfamily)